MKQTDYFFVRELALRCNAPQGDAFIHSQAYSNLVPKVSAIHHAYGDGCMSAPVVEARDRLGLPRRTS